MSGSQTPETPDLPPNPSPLPEDANINPYKTPSAEMMVSGGYREPFRGKSFGRRLLTLPLWFLLATAPTAAVGAAVFYIITTGLAIVRREDVAIGFAAIIGAAVPSFLMYRWLVLPFQLDRRALLLWALIGVPLVAMAWGAIILALYFAVCLLTLDLSP